MIQCPTCNGPMTFNSKGGLCCPTCSNVDKSVKVIRLEYNNLAYYRVIERENVDTPNILVEEDLAELIKKGIKVSSKEGK